MTAPVTTENQPPIRVEDLEGQLPPLATVYGPTYPAQNAPDPAAVAYIKRLIEDTNPIAHILARQAAKHAHYASGRMWLAWNNHRREYAEIPREPDEIRVSMNHIRPILRAKTARLLSAPVQFTIIPDSNSLEQKDRADSGIRFLAARYRFGQMHQKLDTALEYSYYAGCAALKSFWNKTIGPLQDAALQVPSMEMVIGPDGLPFPDPETGEPMQQPVIDPKTGQPAYESQPIVVESGSGTIRPAQEGEQAAQYRVGDTDTALRTVFQIRLNPEATGWTPAEGLRWLLDVDEVPVTVAKMRWPHLAARLGATQDQKPTATAERAHNTALIRDPTPGMGSQSTVGQTKSKEPTVLVAEYWELEGPYFPRGRLIQIVGDAKGYDGDFPDGVFPYDPVFDEPAPGWAYGRASVADMTDPADVINRQWTAITQEMYDQGLGQYVAWDVAGVPDQLGREPRLVMKLPQRTAISNRSIRDVFARIEHPPVAPDRWRMIEAAERTLFDVGAYHEVTRGQIPPGLDSGVAIEKLLEQENGQAEKAMNALRETLIAWGRKQMKIARKYYTTPRLLPTERPDMGYMVEGVSGLDLPDPDRVVIELEHFKPRSKSAFRAEIMELADKQLIPPGEVLRLLDMGRGVDGVYASQTRHYAKARMENLWIERGQAQFIQIGEQPLQGPDGRALADPVTGEPPLDEETGAPAMEPVMRVVVAAHIAEQREEPGEAPEGQEPEEAEQPIQLILPENDDHGIHRLVLAEIILDVTKPWSLRQLALAHDQEHAQAQAAQQAAMAPPSIDPGQ